MCVLTNGCFKRRKYSEKDYEIGRFFAFIVLQNGCFSTNFFFVCDTCDSKKTKSLLEGARIYAREGLEGDKQSVNTRKQRYEYTEIREYKDTEI